MRISSASGDFIELRLDGYQFEASPRRAANDWDANWLYVNGRARWLGETWSFWEPCLTTWEAGDLLRWLRSASVPQPQPLVFTEPNLAFTLERTVGGGSTLIATLWGEAAPPSTSLEERWDEGVPMTFRISNESLAAAADDWEREVAAHPPR